MLSIMLCLFSFSYPVYSENNVKHPILIISSYNPDASLTFRNISTFIYEYKALGGNISSISIENMNCKSFSEATKWGDIMRNILSKYVGDMTPKAIILLGQEAWFTYISQDNIEKNTIPVLCGMISRNAVILPTDTINLRDWEPESIDVFKDSRINVSGYAYNYDIEKNVRLLLDFYPDTKHIAFISDNSYGGVTLQAFVKSEIRKKFPDVDLILLDGRAHTLDTIVTMIRELPENTVILLGTWRVDKNDSYFMHNATDQMMAANPKIPAFTITSIALEQWAIGGYIPDYTDIGVGLAQQVMAIVDHDSSQIKGLQLMSNSYNFNYLKLKEFGFEKKELPKGSIIKYKQETFFDKYELYIWAVCIIFAVLFLALLTTFSFYIRTKKLKDELIVSEANLLKAKEKAEESDRLKSAFLANMSHEIRTPLNAIVGFSNVLVSSNCSIEEQKEFVEVIQVNSDLLLRLINDILDISRLETGKTKITYEICELVSLCQGILTTTVYSKKTTVEYIFEPPMENFMLHTDVQRLRQVLINLLSNANKFTWEGKIRLGFTIDEDTDCVIFSVTDTGTGIPLEKQKRIFERFEKLDEYAQGTGLGLAICKIIVEMLGGTIWVDQEYKEGARFMFSHPIHRMPLP